MKKIRKIYMPSVAIVFMCTVVFSSVWNIWNGMDPTGYHAFIVQLLGFIVVIEVLDFLLGKVDFKSYFRYYLCELAILYPLFMGCARLFEWFPFEAKTVGMMSMGLLAIYTIVHYHFYRLFSQEADEINQLLQQRDRRK